MCQAASGHRPGPAAPVCRVPHRASVPVRGPALPASDGKQRPLGPLGSCRAHHHFSPLAFLRFIMSSFFGFRVYPTPIVKPLFPFAIATAVVGYTIKKIQDSGSTTPEALKDPKNPWGMFFLR